MVTNQCTGWHGNRIHTSTPPSHTVPSPWVRLLRTLTQRPDEHLAREVTVAPHTLLVGGGFVVPLFRHAVLCVRHRSGMGVPNGPANFLLSEVVIKAGWGVGAAPG